MKAKKALKRLNKVELLLSQVIDQFSAGSASFGELLGSAKAAVVRAQKAVNSQLSARTAKKPPLRPQTAQPDGLTAEGRKNVVKRKGMNAVTGRRLSKTA
jgi:hypothetical protein